LTCKLFTSTITTLKSYPVKTYGNLRLSGNQSYDLDFSVHQEKESSCPALFCFLMSCPVFSKDRDFFLRDFWRRFLEIHRLSGGIINSAIADCLLPFLFKPAKVSFKENYNINSVWQFPACGHLSHAVLRVALPESRLLPVYRFCHRLLLHGAC